MDELLQLIRELVELGCDLTITIRAEAAGQKPPVDATFTETCPKCGWVSKSYGDKKSAQRSLRAHMPKCKGTADGEAAESLRAWLDGGKQ